MPVSNVERGKPTCAARWFALCALFSRFGKWPTGDIKDVAQRYPGLQPLYLKMVLDEVRAVLAELIICLLAKPGAYSPESMGA